MSHGLGWSIVNIALKLYMNEDDQSLLKGPCIMAVAVHHVLRSIACPTWLLLPLQLDDRAHPPSVISAFLVEFLGGRLGAWPKQAQGLPLPWAGQGPKSLAVQKASGDLIKSLSVQSKLIKPLSVQPNLSNHGYNEAQPEHRGPGPRRARLHGQRHPEDGHHAWCR